MKTDQTVDYTMAEMIAEYRRLRTHIGDMVKAIQPFEDAMKVIGSNIKQQLLDRGEKSVKTDEGTAFLSHVLSVTVDNRDKFIEFIQEGHWEFADPRPLKDPVKKWMDDNPTKSPTEVLGLQTTEMVNLSVRKPT